ncbi:MAG: hypothetical protein CMK09_15555 [Ponticaulis sp.]|nr:hypothetical protein [Ponticaulis sp.]|tara:strand:- start:2636 stop:3070 length:435 start_codon:yes stop_codon:yes gene_type:complete
MSDAFVLPLVIAGFLIVFPLFWCGVVGFIAYTGGWQSLAATYPAQPSGAAVWKHMTSGILGTGFLNFGQYSSILSVGKDARYIHLKVMPLFSIFHPQISIPVSDISRHGRGDSIFTTSYLSFADSTVKLRISNKLANWVMYSNE